MTKSIVDKLVHKAEVLASIIVERSSVNYFVENLVLMMPSLAMNFSDRAWYTTIIDMKQFFPTLNPAFEASLIKQSEVEAEHLVYANACFLFLSVVCSGLKVTGELSSSDDAAVAAAADERTVLDDERISLPDSLLGESRLFEFVCNAPLAVVYMNNLTHDTNCSSEVRELSGLLNDVAVRFFSRLSKKNLDLIESAIFEKCTVQVETFFIAVFDPEVL